MASFDHYQPGTYYVLGTFDLEVNMGPAWRNSQSRVGVKFQSDDPESNYRHHLKYFLE